MATGSSDESQHRFAFFRSVRGRLSTLAITVIVVTIVLLTIIDFAYIRAAIRDEIHIELQLQSDSMRDVIHNYVRHQRERINLIASKTHLRLYVNDHSQGLLTSKEFEEQVSVVLDDTLANSPDLERIRILDLDGVVIASTSAEDIGKRLDHDSILSTRLQDVRLDSLELLDEVSSYFSAQVKSQTDETLAVVLLDFKASRLLQSLRQVSSGHASSEVRLGSADGTEGVRYLFDTRLNGDGTLKQPFVDRSMLRAIAGESGFNENEIDARGVNVLVVYMPVGYRDWGLVSQVDVADAYATIYRTLMVVVFVGIVLALVAIVLATLGVNRLLKPIQKLAEASRKIAQGQYGVKLEFDSKDEVGALGQSFNDMATKVRDHTEELEAEVKSRTQEVEKSRDYLAAVVRTLEGQTDLMQRDLRRAEIFQKSLLPKEIPQIDGFAISTLYLPGRNVGGDLYDVVQLDEEHVVFLIADAAGHGASAAMLSVLFKLRIEGVNEYEELYRPKKLFTRVNDALVDDVSAPGVFVTATVCILNTKTRDLVFCSAGHPPVLIVRASGEIEYVTRTGPAMGLSRNASFAEKHVNLIKGDRVLFYTDGLFDVGDCQPSSLEEIAELVRAPEGKSPVLKQLLACGTGGSELTDRDDATLILLEAIEGDNWVEADDPATETNLNLQTEETAQTQEVKYAETASKTFLYLIGRVTWLYGQSFYDAATSVIEEQRPLVIEMEACDYLDSAMLGTLYEIVAKANQLGSSVVLQHPNQNIIQTFDELGLGDVIDHIATVPEEVPAIEDTVSVESPLLLNQGLRLLQAHKVLAELNSSNKSAFESVVENLRDDLMNEE